MSSDTLKIKRYIRAVADFPKAGVMFRDITPLLESPRAFRLVCDTLVQRYIDTDITHVGAMDARGFLIGSVVAYALNKPLVLFRKAGKLPTTVIGEAYQTEYGQALLEVHSDSLSEGDCLLLLDDLIATGGTLLAAACLSRRLGARIHEAAVIIDLPELGGSRKLEDMGIATFSLSTFALNES
jgi:adenine phosphoribosyltransferase